MVRQVLGALAFSLLGVEAVEVHIGAHVTNQDLVSEAFTDSLQLVGKALDAGDSLQTVIDASESGTLGQLLNGMPEAAVALNSRIEDDAEGAPGGKLDALMKAGEMIMKGLAGSEAPAGGATGVDMLKALGNLFSGKRDSIMPGKVSAEDQKKIKEFESKFTGQGSAGGSANEFLTKKAKSSTEFGPASNKAAKAFAGSGSEELLKKLGKVVGAAQPAAVKRLQAAVDREPDQLLVKKLTNLKRFLAVLAPNDPKYKPLRETLETPEGIRKLARFAESIKDVELGYAKNGEMWGITDEGFDATARLVAASEAMDGRQHEPFSAETAMALKKYMGDHPEEARSSIKMLNERYGTMALKK